MTKSRASRLTNFLGLAALALAIPLAQARADILMIDLHVTNSEVKAAAEAAEARGEKLIVLPLLSKIVRDQLEGLQIHLSTAEYRVKNAKDELDSLKADHAAKPALDRASEKLKRLNAAQNDIELQRSVIEKKLPDVNSAMIRKAIQGIEASHHALTSLIISGHSNGLEFWGDEWEITRQEIKGILDGFPASRRTLRSVFLWGCYSAERGDIEWWKTSFPKLQVILGFSGVAPGGVSDASPDLLSDALARENEMARAKEMKKAEQVFKSLASVKATNAAAAINECYFDVHSKPVRLDSVADCPGAEQDLQAGFSLFSACYAASPRCPNPPENTHDSGLREYYTSYLEYAHCARESSFIDGLPSREVVLALIFYANVRGNFALYYKSRIEAANTYLAKHGSLRFPNLRDKTLSRQTILHKLHELHELGPPASRNSELQKLLDQASSITGNLECIPTTWITEEPESGHSLAAPAC